MSSTQRNRATGLYWIGVTMTLACFAFIVAGNTEIFWPFEHARFPVSWVLGGAAVLAFLAFEFFDSGSAVPSEVQDRGAQLSLEWEAVEP